MRNPLRIPRDSNARPSAPEAEVQAQSSQEIEANSSPHLPRSEILLKELATALLLGGPNADPAALVEAVLSSERVRLALEVQKGGELAARRAIELAAIVLRG